MKKMLLFSILLITINIGYAQEHLSIGLSFGGNASDANYTNVPNFQSPISNVDETTKTRLGLQGAIRVSYHLQRLELGTGIAFEQKGYLTDYGSTNPTLEDAEVRYTYLSLPVSARYYIVKERLYTGAGASFSFLTGAKSVIGNEEIDLIDAGSGENPFLPEINRMDIGVHAELGMKITEQLGLEIRYIHGLTSLYDDLYFVDQNGEPFDNNKTAKFKNRSLQLSLYYNLITVSPY